MTDKELELSRRKVLAGLGTIGVASAGAGLGTSAWLSDQESFLNNRLMAGSLDLKVDWEEHYYDESRGADHVTMVSGPDDVPDDHVGMPNPDAPMYAVPSAELGAFMDATSIEAYPDGDDDGVQDDLEQYDACVDLADMAEDLDPNGGKELRTANSDTVDEQGNPKPLVALDDVKPGDFGELTLSYHLCDNPGYVWLNGGLVEANENDVTEPEGEDDDEDGAANSTDPANVELLDAVQTMLWYDEDGDNVYEPGGEAGAQVDVVLVLDRSGSMAGSKIQEEKTAAKNLVDALNLGANAAQVGVVSFATQERLDHELSTDASSVKSAIDGISTSGSTNLEGGVNGGEEELTGNDLSAEVTASGNHRSGADKVMVVLSDGAPNVDDDTDGSSDPVGEASRAKGNGIELFTIGFGISSGSSTAQTLEDMASTPKNTHAYIGGTGELTQIFGQISQTIAGEECFFSGSLGELLTALGTEHGIPLDGDRSTPYDEVDGSNLPNAGDDPNRDCFVDSTTNALGLAWWLPVDHANEIQSDSVSFDVGFYTEQCRHNDGAGLS